ncbi:SusC/RagA family TonB-linked outer membrane protein [Segatella bryantii]|jgi:TonB-linked SusC/RagA family outer membrane protein|uniref:SusC/RagA family TonB-linked outer membrane protein n=1 Tax=Segatella bryantii TaxID=77095 RepID=UPI00156AE6FB|nr:TonB-dependent receptor [Segatella bryantii]MBQ3858216.1 TonB-dependent receptor [Prevotella sp.]
MNSKKLLKTTALPTVVACSALAFSPYGVQTANAAVQIAQQANSIKGTVVDDMGEPVIGATIKVVGAKGTGTVTDLDGNFVLNVKPGTKLQISYIGYDNVTVDAKNGLKVQLKSAGAVNLKGVEVVAYGVQKKVTVTGALSSVKGDDLVKTPISSVNNVLAGQLSGVTTVQYSGEPGSDAASIFVRGKGSWENSSPLIQVDGVERSMSDIDPNEIESITVLKDASATAVFGVRGANGVVLITTKRGQEGKAKITASTTFSALTPTKMVEQASSYDYATFYNAMLANDGSGARFSQSVIDHFKNGDDPIRFPNMKWADYIMKDVTLQTQSNVNISGGTKKLRYFISAGMYTTGGLFKQFDESYDNDYRYERFNYRANIDLDLTPTTTLSANLSGMIDEAKKPYTGQGSSGMIKNIYYATPFSSPGIVDGRYIVNTVSTADNSDGQVLPFVGSTAMTYYGSGFMNTNKNKLSMDLQLTQKLDFITKGLSWRVKGSYNSQFDVYKQGSASVATYTPVYQGLDAEGNSTYLYRKNGDTTEPSYAESRGKARDWYFETAFNYNRTFGMHTVGALALYNQSKTYYPSGSYSDIPHGYVGLVGRVTYDWNNRYMAEFNVGYNGSENFAPEKRYGFFPAGSVGWVASDEPFFKPLKKVISFLKLRASWGLVGNDWLGSAYRFYYTADPYTPNQTALFNRTGKDGGAYGYNFGVENGTTKYGAIESQKHNPDITWETAFKQDYGVDVNFFNDRLRATFDYFRERRKDIFVSDGTVPTFIGFTAPRANLGEAKSWGYEVSLNWNDKIGKEFRYWVKANLSYNQNEVIDAREAPMNNEYQYSKGHRIGARSQYKFWKFYYEGAETDYEKEFGSAFPKQLVNTLEPGDAVYVDLDKNGIIDGNDMSRDYGYTDDPEYIAGLNFGFQWKGLSLNAQFTGAWNVSRMLSDVFRQPFYSSSSTTEGGLLQYHVDNTWTAENPSQSSEYPRATWTNAAQNYATSTLYEKDAKYLRLKTLMVAYDFKFPFMKTLGLTQLQVSLSGYNLFTVTPYKWGDPETRASNAPSYPLQRTYTLGVKVGF